MSIAEEMVNGECCSLCGVYFEEEHGYPVLCDSCYDEQEDNGTTITILKHIYPEIKRWEKDDI